MKVVVSHVLHFFPLELGVVGCCALVEKAWSSWRTPCPPPHQCARHTPICVCNRNTLSLRSTSKCMSSINNKVLTKHYTQSVCVGRGGGSFSVWYLAQEWLYNLASIHKLCGKNILSLKCESGWVSFRTRAHFFQSNVFFNASFRPRFVHSLMQAALRETPAFCVTARGWKGV